MRVFAFRLVVLVAGLLLAGCASLQQELPWLPDLENDPTPAGRAVRQTASRVDQAGHYCAVPGETLYFPIVYTAASAQAVRGLEVKIDGQRVWDPRVERTTDPGAAGHREISFVYEAKKEGTFKIQVAPIGNVAKPGSKEFVITVIDPQREPPPAPSSTPGA
jgi:hypothetical protein